MENLKPDEVKELMEMLDKYEKPSYEDISVLVLAKARNTVLITGDEALRIAAADNGVDCHGTCWLIDYLANQSLISLAEAIAAYDLIRKNGIVLIWHTLSPVREIRGGTGRPRYLWRG